MLIVYYIILCFFNVSLCNNANLPRDIKNITKAAYNFTANLQQRSDQMKLIKFILLFQALFRKYFFSLQEVSNQLHGRIFNLNLDSRFAGTKTYRFFIVSKESIMLWKCWSQQIFLIAISLKKTKYSTTPILTKVN